MSDSRQEKQPTLSENCHAPMKFTLIIPAFNEEGAISETLESALRSREKILQSTPIQRMDILLVDDGSVDGTLRIAEQFADILRVHFSKNRGYGAAIKAGFKATDAQILGFMDADGTCDPLCFIGLIQHLFQKNADVVLGSRLNPGTQMPWVRKLGNKIFARLIGWVSGQKLTDVASGIRVIRRESLKKMVPLPDGLHFTPAMSAIAVLDPRLRIEEIPVDYRERVGRSKLKIIKDGILFLSSILFASLCYNPLRISFSLSFGLAFFATGLSFYSSQNPGGEKAGQFMAAALLFLSVLSLFSGLLAHQANYLLIGARRIPGAFGSLLVKIADGKTLIFGGALLCLLSALAAGSTVLFLRPPEFLSIVLTLLLALGGWIAVEGILFRIIWAARQKQKAELEDPFTAQPPSERNP